MEDKNNYYRKSWMRKAFKQHKKIGCEDYLKGNVFCYLAEQLPQTKESHRLYQLYQCYMSISHLKNKKQTKRIKDEIKKLKNKIKYYTYIGEEELDND